MASPHTPYHPQPGPSYYPHPPPPPPPHYAYSPAPGPTPYYPYPMPPMNGPAPMHQPASPRINGAGRGRFNSHRGGGPGYHYQPPMPQHHMHPPAVPVQSPPPVSPASPFHHPQKFVPHPHGHPHQVPYGSPYHHPQPNGPYPPAWPGQTLSPLPKQLSMLPPMVSAEHVPQVQVPPPPQHHQPQLHQQAHLPPPPQLSPEMSQHLQATPIPATENLSPQVPSPTAPPFVPRQSQVQVPQPAPRPVEPEPVEPVQAETASDEVPSPQDAVPRIREPEPEPEGEPPVAEAVSDDVEAIEAQGSRPSTPRSPSPAPTPSPSFLSTYVIWSRRPGDPGRAPGVIISTRAYPPDDVAQKAIELPSPPASPKTRRVTLAKSSVPPVTDVQETSPESVRAPSVSTADTTPAGSIATDTPVPGSPYSCATSISAAVGSPSTSQAPKSPVSPRADNKPELPSGGESTSASENALVVSSDSGAAQPAAEAQASQDSAATSTSAPTASAAKPAPGPKKSWASLLQSSDSAASSSKPRLPVSNVVGFSIPATSGPNGATTPGASLASANRNELLNLLNNGPSGSSANVAAAMKIRPRGLVNTGNMCFANAVLQILVYCPPFHRFFSELRKHLAGPVVGSQREGSKATPLVDATIQFLKEFVPDPPAPGADSKAKGKEREDDLFDELDSFIPTYVYDAMKEKKRFANMIGGHQEDAEEFLGFFLDTLEEELLSISQSLSPKEPAKDTTEDAQTQDGEWLEVGKKNKAVTTRSTKSTDSPITRIFGGKFRSTLRTPYQRDSVTIEDWRSLQLDIQPENVKTLRDALQHISHPQQVQISIPTRPTPIDATQQVLIEALPPVLILHMKRFLYDTKVGDVVKLGKQVSFSPELEIASGMCLSDLIAPAKRTAQPVKYQLFGVLYHHGPSASGGHYTLDVLHPNRELSDRPRPAWIRIDDELVSDVRPDDVFGGLDRDDRHAYLLFYRRMTAWGPSRTN
ncbi:cysteine proteinase [Trametes coccinea BRFM310]|uniref:Ubiquitin carboxyl-terminal hydrolase n=1 Tax=Trametes coccinea (strain BRFM310) TaxID=1353009 RepID=A0A1Y2J4Y7_TRAC3|nr:cysteine proteinase [Trametes coccinea BRFM310]